MYWLKTERRWEYRWVSLLLANYHGYDHCCPRVLYYVTFSTEGLWFCLPISNPESRNSFKRWRRPQCSIDPHLQKKRPWLQFATLMASTRVGSDPKPTAIRFLSCMGSDFTARGLYFRSSLLSLTNRWFLLGWSPSAWNKRSYVRHREVPSRRLCRFLGRFVIGASCY